MKCREERELLSGYLDGELNDEQRRKVERHLAECASCKKELEELKQLDEYVRTVEIEEPTREFVFSLTRKVMQNVKKKPRFSFFRLTPMLVPITVAILVIIVLANIDQPGKFVSLDDRVIYAETETTKRDLDLHVPELSVTRRTPAEAPKDKRTILAEKKASVAAPPSAPAVAKAKVSEEIGDKREAEGTAVSDAEERMEEISATDVEYVEELEIPRDIVVRAIVDSNGRILKVATGNSIVPEKDTVLENRLQGQQLKPPVIRGRRTQLYVDFTQKKEKKD